MYIKYINFKVLFSAFINSFVKHILNDLCLVFVIVINYPDLHLRLKTASQERGGKLFSN